MAPERLEVAVSPMRRRHLRSVMRIESQVHPRPWSTSLFASELRYPDTRVYLVARVGPKLVGYAGAMLVAPDAHVTNVAVDPRLQGRQVATRLLLVLARRVIDEGCTALTLEVRASNERAQELYRRFGFAPAGIRTKYYEGKEDAVIMWASAIDSDDYRARLADIERSLEPPTRVLP